MDGDNSNSMVKTTQKGTIKRRCCVENCTGNEASSSMFSFPNTIRTINGVNVQNEVQVERCKVWLQTIDQQDLKDLDISKLHGRFFLCDKHFNSEQFSNNSRKKLKRNAVPSSAAEVSCKIRKRNAVPSSTAEVDALDIESKETATTAAPEVVQVSNSVTNMDNMELDFSCLHYFSAEIDTLDIGCEEIVTTTAPEVVCVQVSNSVTNIDNMEPNTDNMEFNADNMENIDNMEPDSNSNCQGTVEGRDVPRVRVQRKCCATECTNNNSTSRLFSFPSILKKNGVDFVSVDELNRFKIWIKNVGLSKLLLLHPSNVCKRFYLCSSHFQPNSFQLNGLLKRTAVPTLFFKSSLSAVKFAQYEEKLSKLTGRYPNESVDLFNPEFIMGSKFEDEMKTLEWRTCDKCHEKFLVSSVVASPAKCLHGKHCDDYTVFNDMDPGDVPEELADLTFVEEQLIARIHPLVVMFKLKRLQYGYAGNVISFPQAVQELATELPRKVKDLTSVINVKFSSEVVKARQFQVRAGKVLMALQWLKINNPFYEDIVISEQNINSLPEDGSVYDELMSLAVAREDEKQNTTKAQESSQNSTCDGEIHHQSEVPGTDNIHDTNIQFSAVPLTMPPHQDEQIDSCLEWPTMDKNPADEFNHVGRVVCSFPTLFPYGKADLRSARTITKVSDANYFKHLMRYEDGRFARHPTFRFFALNSLMRWSALRYGSIFIRRNEQYSNVTTENLKRILEENPGFRYKLMFQGSHLRGTKAYWNARANELKDMVEQLTAEHQRLPTLFFTLSPADMHWPDLYRLLSHEKDVHLLTEAERRKLLQDNPMVVDEFFDVRVKQFLKHVIEPAFGVEDFWYRVEYQHRGSPHVHGLLWLKDAPDVRNLETASAQKQAEVIEYFDRFVTAVNPDPQCPKSNDHPSRVRFEDIEDPDQDLAQLVRTVQRHTKCSTAYCIRFNKKSGKNECRFKFPKELSDTSTLKLNENGILEFVPARNDELLNKFNELCMRYWRANLDISPVSSEKTLIAYIAKYISKCESQSESYDELFSTILNSLKENDSCKKFAQRYLIRTCAERDFSAQEVCHLLLGRRLFSSSRTCTYINLSADQQWIPLRRSQNDGEDDEAATGSSLVQKYKDRPPRNEDTTLWEAASSFDVKKWQPKKKKSIVRLFPRYQLQEDDTENEKYYRQMVLLHCPWRHEETLVLNKTWKQVYVEKDVESRIRLQWNLSECNSEDEYEISNEEEESPPNEQWMIAARLGPAQQVPEIELGLRECDKSFKWIDTFQKYAHYGSIHDMTHFIETKKKETESDNTATAELPNVQFNEEQSKVKELIMRQIDSFRSKTDDGTLPKRIIIQGKAGTGKSLLIKYLTYTVEQELGKKKYVLLASTGIAALNINGQTVHSFFNIPRDAGKFEDLKGELARNLAEKLRDVRFLIIDEFSMIGSTMLAMIDKRCRQGTGVLDRDFGGLIVYLLGDIRQLPPVRDSPLYSSDQRTLLAKHGKVVFENFQVVFFLHQCHRQVDENFLRLLDEISVGKITVENFTLLSSRFTSKVLDEEKRQFKDCLHLFSTKDEVHKYNMSVLENLKEDESSGPVPVARIPARHNCRTAAAAEADDADGLESTLYLAKGCKVMLRKNIWTSKGLVNGALGKVIDILYESDKTYPDDAPTVILCSFNSYKGPSLIPGTKIVPITKVSANWTKRGVTCTRVQFPLSTSYACSIHKSQGMTLDKAVVNIGNREFNLGLTYVALSRVKTLKGLLLHPVCYDRIANLEKLRSMLARNMYEDVLKSKRAGNTSADNERRLQDAAKL